MSYTNITTSGCTKITSVIYSPAKSTGGDNDKRNDNLQEEEEPLHHILVTEKKESISFDECIWCTGGSAQEWIESSGLHIDENGFILVEDTLESVSTPYVFATGDIASMINHHRPKAGVYAVRQGPPLDENLRRKLRDDPLLPFTPQSTHLALISTGNAYCVASKGNFIGLEGSYLWDIKDYIDRKWMKMYTNLPKMTEKKEFK